MPNDQFKVKGFTTISTLHISKSNRPARDRRRGLCLAASHTIYHLLIYSSAHLLLLKSNNHAVGLSGPSGDFDHGLDPLAKRLQPVRKPAQPGDARGDKLFEQPRPVLGKALHVAHAHLE